MRYYKTSRNGKDIGTYTEVAFREMVKNGLFDAKDAYWTEGMTEWGRVAAFTASLNQPSAMQRKPVSVRRTAKNETKLEDRGSSRINLPAIFIYSICLAFVVIATLVLLRETEFGQGLLAKGAGSDANSSAPKSDMVGSRSVDRRKLEFIPFSFSGKEVFASAELTLFDASIPDEEDDQTSPKPATNYGAGGLGVAVYNVLEGESYAVEVRGDRFLKPSRVEVVMKRSAKVVTITPKEIFDYQALQGLRQSMPFTIDFSVQRGQEPPKVSTEVFRIRPVNDCPIAMRATMVDEEGKFSSDYVDTSFILAGFVNETHPWIDQILKSAKRYNPSQTFAGYQGGAKGVREQVSSVWRELQRQNITYSSIAVTSGSAENLVQHVRFLDETISNQQANCVDGTVVFCSILQKIGLHTGIVLMPGHAYLVVFDEKNEAALFGVETTMLATSSFEDAVAATRKGPNALRKIEEKIASENSDGYSIVKITDARRLNINPIPYTR